MTTQDAKLIERMKEDDKSALEVVYRAHRSAFLIYARRYDLPQEDLLDVYQDAVIAMYQNFTEKDVTLKSSGIKTYLFGIAKNKIFNLFSARKKMFNTNIFDDNYEEVLIDETELTLEQKLLARHFGNLGESCQKILKMFYYRSLSVKEIVKMTDYKDENTVKAHKSRCLKKLRNLVKS